MNIIITPNPGAPASVHQAAGLTAEVIETNNGNYLAQLKNGQMIAISPKNCEILFLELTPQKERKAAQKAHNLLRSPNLIKRLTLNLF